MSEINKNTRSFSAKSESLRIAIQVAKKGMSTEKFANKHGLERKTLNRILAGNYNPTLKTICDIEQAIGKELLKIT